MGGTVPCWCRERQNGDVSERCPRQTLSHDTLLKLYTGCAGKSIKETPAGRGVEAEEQPGTSEAQEEEEPVSNGGAVEAEAGSAQPEPVRHRKPKAAARSAQEGASNGAVVKWRKGEKGRLSLLLFGGPYLLTASS